MALIEDIKPPKKRGGLAPTPPEYIRQIDHAYIEHVDTNMLVMELHNRAVSIQDIFGMYYQIEAIGDAEYDLLYGSDEARQHGLTVEDALTAGHDGKPQPKGF